MNVEINRKQLVKHKNLMDKIKNMSINDRNKYLTKLFLNHLNEIVYLDSKNIESSELSDRFFYKMKLKMYVKLKDGKYIEYLLMKLHEECDVHINQKNYQKLFNYFNV